MKINVLFLIENIHRLAGTERATINIANEIVKNKDYSVHIISLHSCIENMFSFDNDNIRIVDADIKKSGKLRYMNYLHLIFFLNRYIKEKDINVLVGTGHAYNILITILPRKVIKIGWEHRIYEACPKMSSIARRLFYRKLDALITLSNEESQKYKSLYLKKICVIPNVNSFENDTLADLNNKVVVSLGRLERIKGFEDIIYIASILKSEFPDWHFEIYGDGSERERLLELITQHGVDKYVKVYHATNEVREVLMQSSIYLMTSREECLPMSLIEAMSCGIPTVSYNCPVGPRNIIRNDYDGFLVPMFDFDDAVEKLKLLIDNYELRKKMGQLAFESAQKYSGQNIVEKWYNLIENMIGINN